MKSEPKPETITLKLSRSKIDEINSEVYDRVNNGVYKTGFATTQTAYEEAVLPLFATLDRLEALLGRQPDTSAVPALPKPIGGCS